MTRGEELELDVDSLAYGGNGVARLDGFVVFVRRGLPGDRVRARVTKVKRSHAEALATEDDALRRPARPDTPCFVSKRVLKGGDVDLAVARPVELAEEDALVGAEGEAPVAKWDQHLRARGK